MTDGCGYCNREATDLKRIQIHDKTHNQVIWDSVRNVCKSCREYLRGSYRVIRTEADIHKET